MITKELSFLAFCRSEEHQALQVKLYVKIEVRSFASHAIRKPPRQIPIQEIDLRSTPSLPKFSFSTATTPATNRQVSVSTMNRGANTGTYNATGRPNPNLADAVRASQLALHDRGNSTLGQLLENCKGKHLTQFILSHTEPVNSSTIRLPPLRNDLALQWLASSFELPMVTREPRLKYRRPRRGPTRVFPRNDALIHHLRRTYYEGQSPDGENEISTSGSRVRIPRLLNNQSTVGAEGRDRRGQVAPRRRERNCQPENRAGTAQAEAQQVEEPSEANTEKIMGVEAYELLFLQRSAAKKRGRRMRERRRGELAEWIADESWLRRAARHIVVCHFKFDRRLLSDDKSIRSEAFLNAGEEVARIFEALEMRLRRDKGRDSWKLLAENMRRRNG